MMARRFQNNEGGPITLRVFFLYMVIPYLIGVYYSKHNLPHVRRKIDYVVQFVESVFSAQPVKYSETSSAETCLQRLLVIMHSGKHVKRHDQPFRNLTVVLRPNGQTTEVSCGQTKIDIMQGLENMLRKEPHRCPINFEKYQVEALLTRLFHSLLSEQEFACQPSAESSANKPLRGLYGYCDRGKDYTPILPDHEQLVPIDHDGDDDDDASTSLPCHFHSAQGIRVTSLPRLAQLARSVPAPPADKDEDMVTCSEPSMECSANGDKAFSRELHLYAVPAGRVFMFPALQIGEKISLPHIRGGNPEEPVCLQVLSVVPRIFEVHNFFDRGDSDDLVESAVTETREIYRIKRSSVGVAASQEIKRTSESGFDTSGPVAMKLKRRGMALLGFDEYQESFTDGLQILRYNETTAYNSHLDWMDPADSGEYDFQSAGMGGNRFATILLYLSDLGEDDGGETVFPRASQPSLTRETKTEVRLDRPELFY